MRTGHRVFVDTSALLALMNRDDRAHSAARTTFEALERSRTVLVTTSYVLTETYALLQSREGLAAVAGFRDAMAPLLECAWVSEGLHNAGLDLVLQRQQRGLSLVDAVSFVYMREQRIYEAFAFDGDFVAEGFGGPEAG